MKKKKCIVVGYVGQSLAWTRQGTSWGRLIASLQRKPVKPVDRFHIIGGTHTASIHQRERLVDLTGVARG